MKEECKEVAFSNAGKGDESGSRFIIRGKNAV
jgi:hypothetical protein